MTRVLMIDGDRALAQSVAMACMESGVAIRIAETLCEGVRYMLESPVSVVLIDSGVLRLSGSDQARLFDSVAPGVPVVVLVKPGARMEEHVKLELQGLHVISKPFDVRDVLAKVEPGTRVPVSRPEAAARVDAVCR
jgi:DNA-binding response OmpR family regulator